MAFRTYQIFLFWILNDLFHYIYIAFSKIMTISSKKQLAAYYTPIEVTKILSNWAIREGSDKILEPSFGGCNFLLSSIEALQSRGCKTPASNIFGCDIDPNAFKFLKEKKINKRNFVLGDFLSVELKKNFLADVVLGNPPYVSIHKMDKEYKEELFKKYRKNEFRIAHRSSLWVYFIVHSLTYLKPGGRMAWVVPDGISFTHYGDTFLKQLEKKFSEVRIIRIQERYFTETGTHEKTSLLLCDGYLEGNCSVKTYNYNDLDQALKSVANFNDIPSPTNLVEEQYEDEGSIQIYPLKHFFTIHIGIVIGDSKRLILNEEKALNSPYFPKYLYPIISKGKQLTGLSINRKKLRHLNSHSPIYLVDAIKMENEDGEMFEKFLLSIPTDVLLNQTFQNRAKLFGYDDFKHPDAFLTYYSQGAPKIIINENKELNSTNSVHRLYLNAGIKNSDTILKLFALQTFCDFLGDEAMAISRQYGNHMYKFELSDASNIPLLLPKKITKKFSDKIANLYDDVSTKIRDEETEVGKKMARTFFQKLCSSAITKVSD
ncbi:HsdM family class I SAM-dependent methyltransferase [Flavobacterium sp.]|uniref:HsdM family class I SAM-dependent methyltransferase n=1 Tax=Flavobacterium sp. TaxID=239 RepID=UPI0039E3E95C